MEKIINEKTIKHLQKEIQNNNLVFFIGAGFSKPLGFPEWKELIILILKELDDKYHNFISILEDNIMSEIEVLEKIKKEKPRVLKMLKEKFNITEDMLDKLDNHRKLWEISNQIITTNYDEALEEVKSKKIGTVPYTHQFEVANLDENYLFKLHGDINDSASCILFEYEYKELYSMGEQAPIFKLKNILDTKTIVFIGFSLNDEYVKKYIFESIKGMFGDLRDKKHYIVNTSQENFSEYNIENITLESYSQMPSFLDTLIELKKDTQIPQSTDIEIAKPIVDEIINPKIAIYTASPLNAPSKYEFGYISNLFKKFNVEVHHKTLNEDELAEHYEFDYCFIFTKTNKNKIILEDEYFLKKSISSIELEEMIDRDKVILFIDDEIESSFDIEVIKKNTQIKQVLMKFLHKKANFDKGHFETFRNKTELPDLIDDKNLQKFVGRHTDIENIIKKVLTLKNENMILTLKGTGGIGKTTLISKVAVEIAQRGKFEEGIKFIQCEFIKDYQEFENKISSAFDMTNALNFKIQLNEQISQDEERLIILDNVETILHIEDTNEIKEFIKYISDFATIVITSREKLNEDFEDVYEIKALSTDEAEELFLKFYPLKKYDKKFLRIKLLEDMLNNNPLAIKLVTKNLPKNKDLQVLKEELENSFFNIATEDIEKIFENEADTNIERTKSIFNSINYSYTRLSNKEKLAIELLSLFPDGIYIENFKKFYNQKEDKDNQQTLKERMKSFSDKDLKSLEDKSMIINNNNIINLQSIIGRFSEYQFNQKSQDEKIEYYKKAYKYNEFLVKIINDIEINDSIQAKLFDQNKNNFLKCLDYMKNLKLNDKRILFISYLKSNFSFFSSPTTKIFKKLDKLKEINNQNFEITSFFEATILSIQYFYGDFYNVYEKIKKKYPIEEIIKNYHLYTKVEKYSMDLIFYIYAREGNQLEEVKIDLSQNYISLSLFEIGEYLFLKKYFDKYGHLLSHFNQFHIELNSHRLDIKALKKYINTFYKTQIIEKVQFTYILLKANKEEVNLKSIKKLIITNPFTDGLKTLMLAMKDDENCSKEMYKDAIDKLYHIRYYHTDAILLYCHYLKEKNDIDFIEWLKKGKELAQKHHYRYLLHQFNCLEENDFKDYNEEDYPLPEKLDYSGVIKKFGL